MMTRISSVAALVVIDLGLTTAALAAGFEFDTSRIQSVPRASLPEKRLTLKAFDTANALRSFAASAEKVESSEAVVGRRVADFTRSWRVERDTSEGSMLIARRAELAETSGTMDREKLMKASTQLLGGFGVPSEEMGAVIARSLMARDSDAEAKEPGPAKLLLYKTFIAREINGVTVEGHRAVITHAPDGSFVRANLLWPPLASGGNKLSTKLTVAEIERRAQAALERERETEGKVLLRWKYVPVKARTGEVALRLVVEAWITPAAPGATETRAINVPVDAF
jgi:hypothetical protein